MSKKKTFEYYRPGAIIIPKRKLDRLCREYLAEHPDTRVYPAFPHWRMVGAPQWLPIPAEYL